MRLTTLGTGTIALTPTRVCAGYLVEAGTVRLLMDCGSGVVHRLVQLGLDWAGITHVAFSHFHTDHMSDFATLVQAWRYGQLPPRSEPLAVIGPVGTVDLLERMAALHGSWLREPGFPIGVIELPAGTSRPVGDGMEIDCLKVPHTDESVAYSIRRGGRRLVYSGDTGYDPMFGEWARGADLLLCECSLPEEMAIESHLTPARCGALAAAALPKHLVLTHFYTPVERVDIRGIIAAHYAGPVTLADDGSTFELEEG
ncbi:MAG: ribonuclease Z [Gemmatimonadaceae bacterium]|nr:ribonuclease Z [Gemmatimonadaceae bacterium]NUO93846.1 ribonuclease Z [Gemmatimonadaceae bacterium]NUP71189.1 ribonuclease Z [Gemmatimonadaceae bacterium]